MIRVGDSKAGVTGLDQVLEKTQRQGWRPEQDGLKQTLVAALRAAGNYVSPSSEEAYGESLLGLYRQYFEEMKRRGSTGVAKSGGRKMKIEILGPGCARCRATEENVRKALAELKLEAEVEHITDPAQFARRGVMLTPGVIVDGQVASSGRVPSVEDVKGWLTRRPA
jgi:small redox-active disulfide protein 2